MSACGRSMSGEPIGWSDDARRCSCRCRRASPVRTRAARSPRCRRSCRRRPASCRPAARPARRNPAITTSLCMVSSAACVTARLSSGILDLAERVVRDHVLLAATRTPRAASAPHSVGHVESTSMSEKQRVVALVLERLPDRLLRVQDVLAVVRRPARDVRRRLSVASSSDDADRVAGQLHVAAGRARRRHLARQRGRRHLAAGHAVDRVVDEDDGDLLAAVGRVQDLVPCRSTPGRRRPGR